MLGLLKGFIKSLIPPALFVGGGVVILNTIFSNVLSGMYLFVGLLPQPNVWYKLHKYPLGGEFLDLLFVSILLGIFIQKVDVSKSNNTIIIILHLVVVYISVWMSSFNFSLPLPITTSNYQIYVFKNYAQMVLLYFLSFNLIKTEKHRKVLLILMSCVLLVISVRVFRDFDAGGSFRWDKRAGGPFEAVGLGANHMGAFFAHYAPIFLALFFFVKNKKARFLFLGTALFSLFPIFYAYSRGAYLAALCVLFVFGVLKKRILLFFLIILFIFWQAILPVSVVDRISMTVTEEGEIEHSAGGRLDLWGMALDLFMKNPIMGVGFDGYAMSMGSVETDRGTTKEHQDVHSIFMRILCEQGLIGFSIFLYILFKSFLSGWFLYKKKHNNNWNSGLGLGFLGCVIGVVVTNLFGDRWSYPVLGAYFWIIWGQVDRCLFDLSNERAPNVLSEY